MRTSSAKFAAVRGCNERPNLTDDDELGHEIRDPFGRILEASGLDPID